MNIYSALKLPYYLIHRFHVHVTDLVEPLVPIQRADPSEPFDPERLIQEKYRRTKFQLNRDYAIPSTVTAIIWLDLIYNMFQPEFHIRTDEEMFFRVTTRIWQANRVQRDGVVGAVYFQLLGISWALLTDKMRHFRSQMFIVGPDQNPRLYCRGQFLPTEVSNSIISVWNYCYKKLVFFNYYLIVTISLVVSGAGWLAELFFPDELTWSPRRTAIFFLSFSAGVHVSIIPISSNFFIFLCETIFIKQKYFIGVIDKLMIQMVNRKKRRERLTSLSSNPRFYWYHYRLLITRIVDFTAEIKNLNSFWNRPISIFLACYTTEVSFLIFVCLVYPIRGFPNFLFPAFAINYFSYVYIASGCCSKIIWNNIRIHSQMKRFHVRYLMVRHKHSSGFSSRLKIDQFESWGTFFKRSSFRMFNGYVVNNRLFELIFSLMIWVSLQVYGKTIGKFITSLVS